MTDQTPRTDAGPERATRKVMLSPELMDQWATRDTDGNLLRWAWHEDRDGWWEPVVTVDYTDNLRAQARAEGLDVALRQANGWAPQALDAALIAEAPILRDEYLAYALRHVQAEVAAVLFGAVDDETYERVCAILAARRAVR